jgi:FkbM family methyltransferase
MNVPFQIIRIIVKLILRRGIRLSYSQDGEDVILASLLKDRTSGIYVDVGGYHPIQYSNTYSLYRRGWYGLVIDANQHMQPLHRFFRPRDIFAHVGISQQAGTGTYYMFSDGAYNTFSATDATELKKRSYPQFMGTVEVAMMPLGIVLAKHHLTQIDVLSIDVEGLDVEVLHSHNWNIKPRIVIIEDNSFDPEHLERSTAYTFLKKYGYRIVAHTPRTLFFTL